MNTIKQAIEREKYLKLEAEVARLKDENERLRKLLEKYEEQKPVPGEAPNYGMVASWFAYLGGKESQTKKEASPSFSWLVVIWLIAVVVMSLCWWLIDIAINHFSHYPNVYY